MGHFFSGLVMNLYSLFPYSFLKTWGDCASILLRLSSYLRMDSVSFPDFGDGLRYLRPSIGVLTIELDWEVVP